MVLLASTIRSFEHRGVTAVTAAVTPRQPQIRLESGEAGEVITVWSSGTVVVDKGNEATDPGDPAAPRVWGPWTLPQPAAGTHCIWYSTLVHVHSFPHHSSGNKPFLL
jgi:hypothetical protein